jgi:hypothetical protein
MYECSIGTNCKECKIFGSTPTDPEEKCLCVSLIQANEGACAECLVDMDNIGDILDELRYM